MQKERDENNRNDGFSLFADGLAEPLAEPEETAAHVNPAGLAEPLPEREETAAYVNPVSLDEGDRRELAAQKTRRAVFSRRSPVFILLALNAVALLLLCFYLVSTEPSNPQESIEEQLSVAAGIKAEQDAQRLWQTSFFDPSGVFAAGELAAALPKPERGFKLGTAEAFYPLYAQNNDFVGWIRIPGTSVDFPVYRAQDNEKYLRANSYLEYDRRGSVFMDFRCPFGLSRTQFAACTILYGHHLRLDESLFAEVENYLDPAYYAAHPLVEFDTLYDRYTWKVIACFLVNVDEADDNDNVFYYLYTEFADDTEFMTYVDEIYERSWIRNPSVEVVPGDKLLVLSTCTYQMADTEARCVLVCRLTRPEEPSAVDVSWAYANENPRLPQVWYDQYEDGINPWKNDPVWNITNDE